MIECNNINNNCGIKMLFNISVEDYVGKKKVLPISISGLIYLVKSLMQVQAFYCVCIIEVILSD